MRTNVPERRCVGCGQSRPKSDMVRFVRGPEGVVPDPAGTSPGRGAYLFPRPEGADRAIGRRGFQRSFRAPVTIGPEAIDFIERMRGASSP
jgi:uncharacterized protein